MVEDHYRLKRLEMALAATGLLLKSTRICYENMPKTTRLATLPGGVPGPGARFLRFCVIQCIGSNFESERVCEGSITLIR